MHAIIYYGNRIKKVKNIILMLMNKIIGYFVQLKDAFVKLKVIYLLIDNWKFYKIYLYSTTCKAYTEIFITLNGSIWCRKWYSSNFVKRNVNDISQCQYLKLGFYLVLRTSARLSWDDPLRWCDCCIVRNGSHLLVVVSEVDSFSVVNFPGRM